MVTLLYIPAPEGLPRVVPGQALWRGPAVPEGAAGKSQAAADIRRRPLSVAPVRIVIRDGL